MATLPLRKQFGLTQEMLAEWLGVARSSLALTERGYQSATLAEGVQALRLALAAQGRVYDGAGGSFPAPPPLPEPPADAAELDYRLRQCQAKAKMVELKLAILDRQAAPYVARLAAAPALRAFPGPIGSPDDEASWLTIFELEARRQLRTTCGATARRLLEARLAGLTAEAALLAETIADIPAPRP